MRHVRGSIASTRPSASGEIDTVAVDRRRRGDRADRPRPHDRPILRANGRSAPPRPRAAAIRSLPSSGAVKRRERVLPGGLAAFAARSARTRPASATNNTSPSIVTGWSVGDRAVPRPRHRRRSRERPPCRFLSATYARGIVAQRRAARRADRRRADLDGPVRRDWGRATGACPPLRRRSAPARREAEQQGDRTYKHREWSVRAARHIIGRVSPCPHSTAWTASPLPVNTPDHHRSRFRLAVHAADRAAAARAVGLLRDPAVQHARQRRSRAVPRAASSCRAGRRACRTGAPRCDPARLRRSGMPVLGICYGMQLMADTLGGRVAPGAAARVRPRDGAASASRPARAASPTCRPRSASGRATATSWRAAPPGFAVVATSANAPVAAMADADRAALRAAVSSRGRRTPSAASRSCATSPTASAAARATGRWRRSSRRRRRGSARRSGDGRVVCALSGGVDSTVAALLIHRAIGDQLTCIFVDNGVLRLDEAAQIRKRFERLQLPLVFVDASDAVPRSAGGRDRSGAEAQDHRRDVHRRVRGGSGEARARSISSRRARCIPTSSSRWRSSGQSALIKSHHNVGGLPERMRMKLVEPLRELFKDEVRARRPRARARRGVRRRASRSRARASPCGFSARSRRRGSTLLRRADAIVAEEVKTRRLVHAALAELRGAAAGAERRRDGRRAHLRVHGGDPRGREPRRHDGRLGAPAARSARAHLVAHRQRSRGINRVVYDISSKPPSTIEWE